jgi:hypothetical protein
MGRLDHRQFREIGPNGELELFEFESDFVASLRCIPMAVRFKLDLAGVKLSLRQWSRFTLDDRSQMLTLPCTTPAEIGRYRARLIELIELRAGEAAKDIAPPDVTPWAEGQNPPGALQDYAHSNGLAPPSADQWRGLTNLRRFTLLKLIRDNHDNVNFGPALREFGLAPQATTAAATFASRS